MMLLDAPGFSIEMVESMIATLPATPLQIRPPPSSKP